MKTTHVGLVKLDGNKIVSCQYILSKFERELGDEMVVDGVRYNVGIIGEDRDSVIEALNTVIKAQNKINRKQRYQEDKKINKWFNEILLEAWRDIHTY